MLERQRAKRRLKALYGKRDREYRQKRKNGEFVNYNDFQSWMSSWYVEAEPLEDDVNHHETQHWRKKAVDKLVELPPRNRESDLDGDGYWKQGAWGGWVLSDKGVYYVRSAVRQEVLGGSESYFRWLTLAFAGLAAAAASIAAAVIILSATSK